VEGGAIRLTISSRFLDPQKAEPGPISPSFLQPSTTPTPLFFHSRLLRTLCSLLYSLLLLSSDSLLLDRSLRVRIRATSTRVSAGLSAPSSRFSAQFTDSQSRPSFRTDSSYPPVFVVLSLPFPGSKLSGHLSTLTFFFHLFPSFRFDRCSHSRTP